MDKKIRETGDKTPSVSSLNVALLAAMNIADEYFKAANLNSRSLNQTITASNIETPFLLVEMGPSGFYGDVNHTYIISYDANFKYIDYQELKFARETAKEAKKFSKLAIGISILAFLASILMPIYIAKYFTQTIKLDSSQLELIQKSTNKPTQ